MKRYIKASSDGPYYRIYEGTWDGDEFYEEACVNIKDVEDEAIKYANSMRVKADDPDIHYSVVYYDPEEEYTEEIYHTY